MFTNNITNAIELVVIYDASYCKSGSSLSIHINSFDKSIKFFINENERQICVQMSSFASIPH